MFLPKPVIFTLSEFMVPGVKKEISKIITSFPSQIKTLEGPVFLEVKVKKGNRKDLGRPTTTPIENRDALMQFLKK